MKNTQTPAAENEKWFRIQVQFFNKILLRRPVRKQNVGSSRSRLRHFESVATSGVGPSGTLKNWVIYLTFSITARSASALAAALFGLLEPISYELFDILKLMQVSVL